MFLAIVFAATTVPAVPAPANPAAAVKPAVTVKPPAETTVNLGAFTEFPCFENRTNLVIGGYVRTADGKVEIVRVAPNSGGCLAKLRPDPANPRMSVGTAFLNQTTVTEAELVGREVECVMSPKAMVGVGFRVVVMEEDSGLFCQSVVLDNKP